MFSGPYSVFENGTYSERVAAQKEHLYRIRARFRAFGPGYPVHYDHLVAGFLFVDSVEQSR
jgi:hypothetical protein